ncbi:MAG: AMP-dependent synthetase [Flammeovirgaceae bacterium]|nr:AMP-dependent synthetase [Flammeovirgaceae bacterium]MBE61877.1 AMP-dependent synthetase [Flammeovirgaceae bacterium]MBR10606.1 AMP-dependent synthetase [Rickettsiales bacterium]HCX23188.1 AMP-dependent synthetase [Cytophagales bacterium]|tara:strand:- start:3559 stop:5028 length:1470 start_codon:yes stop_codon:yes gene_type:complete
MYRKDWIDKWAVYSPDKVALKEYETGLEITYKELNERANFLADWLINSKGFQKGDRLMVLAEHCIEYVALFVCSQKTGIILVPVNYRLAPAEVDYLIKDSEPKFVLVEKKFEKLIEGTSHSMNHQWLEDLPKGTLSEFISTELEEDDAVFILYTSGSTGFPKGAIYTHKMLLWNSLNTSQSLELSPSDHTINCMPPFHTGGWNVLVTPMLHRGASVGLLKKFDADLILNLLDEEQCNVFMGVPTMLKMMADSPNFQTSSLESVRYFIIGGEALPLNVINTWHKKGVMMRQGYGLTEVGPNITSLHQKHAERKIGSIGITNFYVDHAILDDDGNTVPTGEIGEFCLRGPMVTPGYWRNEEATKKSIVNGYFHTGDLVRQDEEGFIYVVDRKKSMFISGGENVYPAEVERVLREHPDIDEAAVVGVGDQKWGEVGKAYLSIKAGVDCSEVDVLSHCVSKLAKFKVPKYFEFMDEIPKNGSGKIDRKKLSSL